MNTIIKTVKYDAQRDKFFAKEIKEIPGCENLLNCIQCGTCSATCPLSIYMDYTPRKIINLARSGFKDEVLKSPTIWLCASCYGCTVDCPKEIKVTDVMYALKQRAIRDKVYPKRFPPPVLAREFLSMVRSRGRVSEGRLVMKLFLKTNILKMFGILPLGLKLLRTGRFSLKLDSIKGRKELKKVLEEA